MEVFFVRVYICLKETFSLNLRPAQEMNSEEGMTTSGSTYSIDRVGTKQLDEDVSSYSSDESDEEKRENSKTDLSKKVKRDSVDKVSPSSSSSEESENEFSEASDNERTLQITPVKKTE